MPSASCFTCFLVPPNKRERYRAILSPSKGAAFQKANRAGFGNFPFCVFCFFACEYSPCKNAWLFYAFLAGRNGSLLRGEAFMGPQLYQKKHRRGSFPQPLEVATEFDAPLWPANRQSPAQCGFLAYPFKPLRHADLKNRTFRFLDKRTPPGRLRFPRAVSVFQFAFLPFYCAWLTATAQATVAPTMGLLPMPMRPIISTCAGTEEDPANCASECMRPMVSVMP